MLLLIITILYFTLSILAHSHFYLLSFSFLLQQTHNLSQSLIFDGLKMDAPLRPITDYNVRVFREPKLPKEQKADLLRAKRKRQKMLKKQPRWYHKIIGAPTTDRKSLEKKPTRAQLAKQKKKTREVSLDGPDVRDKNEPPPERLAYYKGRCWGVETVMYLLIDSNSGIIHGEGFNKTIGEFKLQGQYYASKLEEETAENGNAGLMYMFAAENAEASTIGRFFFLNINTMTS